MTDHNSSSRMDSLNPKIPTHAPFHSLSPSVALNQVVVSSRHPHLADNSHRNSMRSNGGSSSTSSRARQTTTGHSAIQMEPTLQALLVAEGQAAEMIAIARTKRTELLRKANRESQAEIDAFRQEREVRYKLKLREAISLEEFQAKLETDRLALLKWMKENVQRKRTSLINYIVSCVIDQIPIRPHPNTKRVTFER